MSNLFVPIEIFPTPPKQVGDVYRVVLLPTEKDPRAVLTTIVRCGECSLRDGNQCWIGASGGLSNIDLEKDFCSRGRF